MKWCDDNSHHTFIMGICNLFLIKCKIYIALCNVKCYNRNIINRFI